MSFGRVTSSMHDSPLITDQLPSLAQMQPFGCTTSGDFFHAVIGSCQCIGNSSYGRKICACVVEMDWRRGCPVCYANLSLAFTSY